MCSVWNCCVAFYSLAQSHLLVHLFGALLDLVQAHDANLQVLGLKILQRNLEFQFVDVLEKDALGLLDGM